MNKENQDNTINKSLKRSKPDGDISHSSMRSPNLNCLVLYH